MPSSDRRRWLRWGLVAVAVLVLAIGGAAAVLLLHSPGNVSHPNLSFTTSTTTTAGTTTTTTTPKRRTVAVDNSLWPRYGFDAARTRLNAAVEGLVPPLKIRWAFQDFALIEFPPSLYQNSLYFVDDNAVAKAVDKRTGRMIWSHKLGTLAAASPAIGVHEHMIFIPVLSNHGRSPGGGEFVALSMRTGHVMWSRPVSAGSESSPLVWDRTVYFGDNGGTVYSLDAATGHVNWTYHGSAAVKGGPALANGILYFGDYAGRAYAVNAATGRQVWAVGTNGTRFGFGSGNFYSTAAVAFGRVYMGNTDGRVYSFAASTGQLAWATATGSYVYGSPAVADLPGIGPTVYVGSYDGNFYAFDAQSGAVRWRHPAGGRISGSATIIDGVVYYSDLGSKTTSGLDARTGRQVFFFPDGAFNPVICDSTAIYLVGYSKIYEMLPSAAGTASATHQVTRSQRRVRHHVTTKRTRTRSRRNTRT
jgi:outer membrane protein assembly factor BamB